MRKYSFFNWLFALAFVFIFTVVLDLTLAFFEKPLPIPGLFAIFLITAAAVVLTKPRPSTLWVFFIFAIFAAATIIIAIIFGFNRSADYKAVDNGKSKLYSDKNVLILVPHQDDELIVAGGVIEEYVRYGSKVSLAFVTNGDYSTSGQTRMSEALSVAQALKIPENRVFFLGYGDRATAQLYMTPEGQLVQSAGGYTATYGLDSHPAYRDGREYIRENLVGDLCDLLLEVRPDIIFCTEIEEHMDHSAVSLFLDEALSEILSSTDDYTPIVLKSSCYATAFYAVNDFYSLNILSTVDPVNGGHFAGIYNWEDRLRLPVSADGLSRSLFGCDTYKQFCLHNSQLIRRQAEGAINGDRVFWLRDTSSLCYDASISASSGYHSFLNDYKICDNFDLYDDFTNLSNNTWVPDEADSEKSFTVILKNPSHIQRICLYDDPDPSVNVLNALITFDDGSSFETGALNKNSVTGFAVNKDNVTSFSVKLLKTEGIGAGITEIEAYSSQRDYGFDFIKLQNMQGDFVYDYYTNLKGEENFLIYSSGVSGEFNVSSDNPNCVVKYEDGIVSVKCPKDQSCVITVISENGNYSDSVVVTNPGRFMRETGPYFERLIRQFLPVNIQQSNCYFLIEALYSAIFK